MNAATCTNVNRVCTRFDEEEHTSVPLAPSNSVSLFCSGRATALEQAVAQDEMDMSLIEMFVWGKWKLDGDADCRKYVYE